MDGFYDPAFSLMSMSSVGTDIILFYNPDCAISGPYATTHHCLFKMSCMYDAGSITFLLLYFLDHDLLPRDDTFLFPSWLVIFRHGRDFLWRGLVFFWKRIVNAVFFFAGH